MKTLLRSALLAGLVSVVSVPSQAGDLKLTMQNGRVTIIAQDVPLRQILQEWARVGNVRIVNAEKLTGPSVTLELIDVPEPQALDTLLRSAAGYMAAPRPVGAIAMGSSLYDRIMILPTSRAPAAVATATATPTPAPFPQRPPQPMPTPTDDDDDPVTVPVQTPPGMPPLVMPNPGGPNPNVPGLIPGANPNQPSPVMTAPRPGALPTPQPTPNGVPNPYQPSVIRPGGPGGPGGPGDR